MTKTQIILGMYVGKYVSNTCPMNVAAMAWELAQAKRWGGTQWVTSCRVDSNRNYLIHDFLTKSKGDFLFIFDEDMIHPPKMPLILADRNLPIVSGLYFRRNEQGVHTPQAYKRQDDAPDARRGHGKAINAFYTPLIQEINQFFGSLPRVPYVNTPLILTRQNGSVLDSGILPMDAAGFGCVMLRRDALEKLEPPYLITEPGLNGDLVFYKKAQEKGIPMFVDCSVIASHRQEADIGVGAFCDFMNHFVEERDLPVSTYG